MSPVEEKESTVQAVKFPGFGKGSDNTTFDAVPGPMLLTTIVKSI